MSVERHLVLQEMSLPPAAEWFARSEGWLVLRVADGSGYWLNAGPPRELGPGDMLVAPRNSSGLLRASTLGTLQLQFFFVQPRLLNGLLALADGQQLDTASATISAQPLIWPAADALARTFAEFASRPSRAGLSLRCHLLQLWADAVAGLVRNAAEFVETPELRDRFRQLLDQMSQAELSACSLGDLAAQLHCSERHLSRLFRDEFGVPFRARQTELRLLRARQILADSNAKIINVAYESGYRHLGLFNTMFKKRFGMTPSEWRQKAAKKNSKLLALLGGFALLFASLPALAAADTNAAPEPAKKFYLGTPVSPEAMAQAEAALKNKMAELNRQERRAQNGLTNQAAEDPTAPKFEVRHYDVRGNTLLGDEIFDDVFADAKGTNVTLAQVRLALADLQLAYRERGFVTAAVSLPQQQISNATVVVSVVEAPLTSISVIGNRYYSSNNIARALPSLHTNLLLNSHVFQRELDLANANRDRQIYPVLGPGAEPGTSELTLKVKDRFPLHGRWELNNQATPGTPELRVNASAQYNNLWDRDHQAGVQYSFTPQRLKDSGLHDSTPFDAPSIANLSTYYRLPLAGLTSVQEEINAQPLDFGYSEITHQFRLPPVSGQPELTFFANRSTSDTGVKFGPKTSVGPTNNPFISIISQDTGQDVTLNEGLGSRFSLPLPERRGIRSTLTLGIDWKRYRLTSFNTNNFDFSITVTNSSGSTNITSRVSTPQPPRSTTIDYLPLFLGYDWSVPDGLGTTFYNAALVMNVLPVLSDDRDFNSAGTNATFDAHIHSRFVTLNLGMSREQKVYRDWSVLLRANGQWASSPLIGNEQFALGGVAGVRGYADGETYGDSGWRLLFEPRTPLYNLGNFDDTVPMWVRASAFMDYGERYLVGKAATGGPPPRLSLWGAGFGITGTIGDHLDARVMVAWPLLDSPTTRAGTAHFYFALGAQF